MNWKNEAVDKLKGYAARRRSLTCIPEEIKRLELKNQSIRAARTDGDPVRGGGNKREDMLLSNLVKREELQNQLADAELWCAGVERALEGLTQEERLVLDRFYVNWCRGNVDRLCEELALERSAVYTRRDKALRSFTLAMYGSLES